MPIAQIHQDNKHGCYFVTPTVCNWYYIFDRHNRWQILADSLIYCQAKKELEIFGYVFMLNHIHLIVRSPDVSGFLRDFKRHTSKKLEENMAETEPKVLDLFRSEERDYHFWKPDNQPKLIENEAFGLQKLNYTHNNPVVKGYVERPEYWKWSSANKNSIIKLAELW